jgi:NAD(P)-dependent dehydrogenase (short-subunit alcohol dehydrogenase family)
MTVSENGLLDLKGKVVLITGSSRGIGRAMAEMFAEAGAKVVVSSRKREACEPVAEAIRDKGGEALVVPCHIGNTEELQNLVDTTIREWGRIDVLVPNAAINPVYGPMQVLDDAVFDKMLMTNVRTINTMCKMVLPQMAENGGGSVVIISSVAAIKGSTTLGAYGVTKAADAAMARALALEWGPQNIRVNAIGPGLIKTDFARALWEDPERIERINNANPLRRMGTVEEIAGTALWLASPLSGYVNGQLIIADGGQSLA